MWNLILRIGYGVNTIERLFKKTVGWVDPYPQRGDLAYILSGIRHEVCLVLDVDGSIYNKNIRDFTYTVLHRGVIKKYKGWRLEKIIDD